jgi:hypothetical protein
MSDATVTRNGSIVTGRSTVEVERCNDKLEVEYSDTGRVVLWAWKSNGDIAWHLILDAAEAQDFFTQALVSVVAHKALHAALSKASSDPLFTEGGKPVPFPG